MAGYGTKSRFVNAPTLKGQPPNLRIENDRRKHSLRCPRALPSAAPHARR